MIASELCPVWQISAVAGARRECSRLDLADLKLERRSAVQRLAAPVAARLEVDRVRAGQGIRGDLNGLDVGDREVPLRRVLRTQPSTLGRNGISTPAAVKPSFATVAIVTCGPKN